MAYRIALHKPHLLISILRRSLDSTVELMESIVIVHSVVAVEPVVDTFPGAGPVVVCWDRVYLHHAGYVTRVRYVEEFAWNQMGKLA